MGFYRSFLSPLIDRFDSESAHGTVQAIFRACEKPALCRKALAYLATGTPRLEDERLRVKAFGMDLENPLFVAAGWDKNGRSVAALHALGFAGVEIGTVTLKPQLGNPKPRLFNIAQGVAINHMGLCSDGAAEVAKNLMRYRGMGIPLGINIGINKDHDVETGAVALAEVVSLLHSFADYFVINVSSPNTPGLRKFQQKEKLARLISSVNTSQDEKGGEKPTYVKIAPELSPGELDDVLDLCLHTRIAGIVSSNTTNDERLKGNYGERWRAQPGGLSGDDAEYRRIVLAQVQHVYRQAAGALEIIGVGAIKNGYTALERLWAGATIVQVLTAIRGEGPGVAEKIKRELLAALDILQIRKLEDIPRGTLEQLPPKEKLRP